MRPRLLKVLDYLFADSGINHEMRKTKRSVKLGVEVLEDRTVPTGLNASGFVSGLVYVDVNSNGIRGSSEPLIKGATVSLTGTDAQNSTVHLTSVTDSTGHYSFRGLLPGTYNIKAGPVSSLLNRTETVVANIALTAGQALNNKNLGLHSGLGPQAFSLSLLLNSTTQNDFHYGTPGKAANNAPTVSNSLGTVSLPVKTTNKVFDLAGFFTDRDYTNSQVRFNITINGVAKTMTLNMFDARTPRTVANFFNYVNAGSYDDVFFNRRTNPAATPTGDGIGVVQGGALTLNSAGGANAAVTGFSLVPIGPTIQNEFGASNTLGTIAMAQSGSDRNSATNQFYFNTTNNAGSLDTQRFTVFGEAADDASRAVLALMAATPVQDLHTTSLTHDFPPAGFAQVPLNGYTGTTFPTDATTDQFLVINSIDVLKRSEFLTYSIVANNNPGLAVSLNNEFLTVNANNFSGATAKVTVRATDRFGAHVDQILKLNFTAAPVVTSVAITPNNVDNVTTLTATPSATPITANVNPITFTYQWLQNGFPITSATAQTLNLASIPKIVRTDTFSVKVTPSQLVVATAKLGAVLTSDPVTIRTASPDLITLVP